MKSFMSVLIVMMLSGCVHIAKHVELEQGRYKISSSGSVLGSPKTYLNKIENRAAKLCGEGNFKYESKPMIETKSSLNQVANVLIWVPYNMVSRVVVCKNQAIYIQ